MPRLLDAGYHVRVLVRDPARVQGRSWSGDVEIRTGDLMRVETLLDLCDDIDAAFYLVHSMGGGHDFSEQDRVAAENFCDVAEDLSHVVYLGGLQPDEANSSEHLHSRKEVGEILRSRLPTTEFRAGPVIGSGSASFEMVRYLTERLPVMIAPKWVKNLVQPVAVRDVLSYLLLTLKRKPSGVVEIGAEPLTFREMMMGYAEARGLKRSILPVPVLTPRLASHWVSLVTPITSQLAVPLVEGVIAPLVGDSDRAREIFPEIRPIAYQEAVQLALERVETGTVETRWSSALRNAASYSLEEREGMIREIHRVTTAASPEAVYRSFASIGGERGWLRWNWLWKIRGMMDQLVGGPGLRRGRRHPYHLLPGESLDFWRVEVANSPERLRLRAEMKLPGKAWLQWETATNQDGLTRLVQTAIFAPKGLWGTLYWWGSYPFHLFIFKDMINSIAREAERIESEDDRSTMQSAGKGIRSSIVQ